MYRKILVLYLFLSSCDGKTTGTPQEVEALSKEDTETSSSQNLATAPNIVTASKAIEQTTTTKTNTVTDSSSSLAVTTNTDNGTAIIPSAQITAAGMSTLPIDGSEPYLVPLGIVAQNVIYVPVTICAPGTNNCVNITVQLDTGSVGLRVNPSYLTALNLPVISEQSNHIAECIKYGGGATAVFGPIATVDLKMGNITAHNTNIQILDANYFANEAPPSSCCSGSACNYFISGGSGGIMGTLPLVDDAINNGYVTYSGTPGSGSWVGTSVATEHRVQNPITMLDTHNNGYSIQIPEMSGPGALPTQSYMILGIGTAAHNTPATTITPLPLNPGNGQFLTTLNGQTSGSVFDTGVPWIQIPPSASVPELVQCTLGSFGFYCPTSPLTMSATLSGYTGTPSVNFQFQVKDVRTSTTTFPSAAVPFFATPVGEGFISWAFPIFIGRTIYFGMQGQTIWGTPGPFIGL